MSGVESLIRQAGAVLGEGFIAPAYLWFLAIVPLIVLLYLLKLRRTQVVISSTLLWMKSLQDLTANAPFQRLRRNLLMLLQIIVVVLLATGLARPFLRTQGAGGRNLCLLIDRSASMQAIEGGKTRVELAREIALTMIDEMQRGDKMMVVTFSENSDVLCELTDDRARLRRAVNSISPTDTRTRLRDAFMVAHSLRLNVSDLHAVIISDGNIGDLDEIGPRVFGATRQIEETSTEARARGYDLSFVQVGETDDNIGITVFSVREPEEGQAGVRQSFLLLHNAASEPAAATVTLSLNDQVLAVEGVEIPAGESREVVFQHGELGEGVLKAELDADDALAVDNTAWLALRREAVLNVLLVAAPDAVGAYFLQRVLAPDPRVNLSTVSPEAYQESSEYDLVVFYNFAPPTLPGGTLLFINAIPPGIGMTQDGVLDGPPVLAVAREHPLLRFNVNPSNVVIRSAVRAVLPEGAREVVSTAGGALIADVSRGGQNMAWIAFDIADSNWPLNLSFPLFFQNLLAWAPRANLAGEASIVAGRAFPLLSRPEVAAATVTGPDGRSQRVELDPLRPVYFSDTQRAGIYTVDYGEEIERFAVNLLDPGESSIRPSGSLTIGRGEFQAQRGQVRQNREFWRWLVALALAVLVLEWWIFSRRAWM